MRGANCQATVAVNKLLAQVWRALGKGRAPSLFNIFYVALRTVFALFALALVLTMVWVMLLIRAAPGNL